MGEGDEETPNFPDGRSLARYFTLSTCASLARGLSKTKIAGDAGFY